MQREITAHLALLLFYIFSNVGLGRGVEGVVIAYCWKWLML